LTGWGLIACGGLIAGAKRRGENAGQKRQRQQGESAARAPSGGEVR
jgi:hypothetical protein